MPRFEVAASMGEGAHAEHFHGDPQRLDDDALVLALKAGEARAPAALFARFAGHVERVLTRIFGASEAEVADMVNVTFLRALDRIDRVEDSRGLRAWLTSIAVNVSREHVRARRRRGWLRLVEPSQLPEPAAEPPHDAAEAVRRLYGALAAMPVDERIAFALRFVDGMELTEVAAACEVSLATIKRTLARAEERFVAISRRDAVLRERLEGGGRWGE
jgi:RNA polymerase sigma-70 factor (ECF subfamily)